MNRRDFLKSVAAVGGAASLAGCIFTGDQTFTAEPARIPTDAAQSAGYMETAVEQLERSQDIEFQGQQRTITIEAWVSSYQKSFTSLAQQTRFGEVLLVSTPNPTIAGQSVNPLLQGEAETLVRRFANESKQVRVERSLGTTQKTVLDEERMFEGFELTATQQNAEVTLHAQIAQVGHESDALLFIALYPAAIAETEKPAALDMLTETVHPADAPSDSSTNSTTTDGSSL